MNHCAVPAAARGQEDLNAEQCEGCSWVTSQVREHLEKRHRAVRADQGDGGVPRHHGQPPAIDSPTFFEPFAVFIDRLSLPFLRFKAQRHLYSS